MAGRLSSRAAAVVGGVVLVAAAAVAVPVWLGSVDAHPASAPPKSPTPSTPSPPSPPSAAPGAPCPDVLPKPTDDDGHGFGTARLATERPTFATPEAAWVCQYGALETGPGHTPLDFDRLGDPVRLPDADLPLLTDALDGIGVVTDPNRACFDDLGPRYLVVTTAGGDVTGTVIDDYGCHDVRLTPDPASVAPGDPADGRTVPGVLVAPAGFLAQVRTWWGGPVGQLHVTCTPSGPLVDATAVAAQPGGVDLVVDSWLPPGSYLTYTLPDGSGGGDPAPRRPRVRTYQAPPGALVLGCQSGTDDDETATTTTVTVTDPHGYWSGTTLADLGCAKGAIPSWAPGLQGEGATADEAVDQTLAGYGAGYTAERVAVGYPGDDFQNWVARHEGVAAFSIVVTRTGDRYRSSPDRLCGGLP